MASLSTLLLTAILLSAVVLTLGLSVWYAMREPRDRR